MFRIICGFFLDAQVTDTTLLETSETPNSATYALFRRIGRPTRRKQPSRSRERKSVRGRHGAVPCAPSGLRGGADGGRQTPAHGKRAACPDLGLGDGLSEGAAARAEGGCAASRPGQRECRCRSNAARWPVGSAPVPQPPFAPSRLGRRASRTTRPRKSAAWRPLQRCGAAHSTDGASRRRSSRTRSPRSVPRPGVASHRLALAALAARCLPRRGGGGTPHCTPAPRPRPRATPTPS